MTLSELDELSKEVNELKKAAGRYTQLLARICKGIRDELQYVEQWKDSFDTIGNSLESYHELKALVELMEAWDCGSVGGFGKDQPPMHNLQERAWWILGKYSPGPDANEMQWRPNVLPMKERKKKVS